MDEDKDRIRFLNQVLDDKASKGYSAWAKAYRSLLEYPDQLSSLTSNAHYQNKFVTDFDQCATRIVEFLKSTDANLPNTPEGQRSRKAIGNLASERLIIPLLGEKYHHLTESPIFFDVLLNTLSMTDNSGNVLRNIAISLSDSTELLGKLLSSNQSEDFLGEWIASLRRGHPHAPTLAAWTDAIANLCATCGDGHNSDELIEQWTALKTLRDTLRQARDSYWSTGFCLQYSDDILQCFQDFGVEVPTDVSSASSAIEYMEISLTFNLLSKLFESMPCRVCFARLNGEEALPGRRIEPGLPAENFETLYEELLGQRLGRWKVVISGQAMKDLQKSRAEGLYEFLTFCICFDLVENL